MIIVSNLIIIFGLAIILLGIIGMIILPDIFLRFHASTKCGVTGVITILLGLIFRCQGFNEVVKIVLIILFLVFTAPITAHMLAISFIGKSSEENEDDENFSKTEV